MAERRGADVALDTETDDIASRVEELTGYNADDHAGGDQSGDAGVDVSVHSCGYWSPHQETCFDLRVANTRDDVIVASIPDTVAPVTVDLHRVQHHGIDLRLPALMHHGPGVLDR